MSCTKVTTQRNIHFSLVVQAHWARLLRCPIRKPFHTFHTWCHSRALWSIKTLLPNPCRQNPPRHCLGFLAGAWKSFSISKTALLGSWWGDANLTSLLFFSQTPLADDSLLWLTRRETSSVLFHYFTQFLKWIYLLSVINLFPSAGDAHSGLKNQIEFISESVDPFSDFCCLILLLLFRHFF